MGKKNSPAVGEGTQPFDKGDDGNLKRGGYIPPHRFERVKEKNDLIPGAEIAKSGVAGPRDEKPSGLPAAICKTTNKVLELWEIERRPLAATFGQGLEIRGV
jgi:hypothetical protein